MEIDKSSEQNKKTVSSSDHGDLIQVRAIISCENCGYKKKFRNQFPRKQLELLTVAIKCFDWLTCNKCGDLLKLDLEFNV